MAAVSSYEERGHSPKAWLYRIAHNAVVDHFRTRKESIGLEEEHEAEPEDTEGIEEGLVARYELDELFKRIADLPPAQGEVLILRFREDMSIAETANILGKKEVTTLALVLTVLGSFLIAFVAPGRWVVIIGFLVLFGIGWGGMVPMLNGLLRQYFGVTHLVSIAGFAGGVLMVGLMIGAPLAGWIFDCTGRYQPARFLFAGVLTIATIVFAKFAR